MALILESFNIKVRGVQDFLNQNLLGLKVAVYFAQFLRNLLGFLEVRWICSLHKVIFQLFGFLIISLIFLYHFRYYKH